MEKERQTYEASPFSFLPLLIIILKTHHYEKCRLTENHLYEYADCTSTYRYTGSICSKVESIPIRPLRISNFPAQRLDVRNTL